MYIDSDKGGSLKLIFLFLNQKICCGYSKAPKTHVKTKGCKNIHNFTLKCFVYLDHAMTVLISVWNKVYVCHFSHKTYAVGTQKNHLIEMALLSNHILCFD